MDSLSIKTPETSNTYSYLCLQTFTMMCCNNEIFNNQISVNTSDCAYTYQVHRMRRMLELIVCNRSPQSWCNGFLHYHIIRITYAHIEDQGNNVQESAKVKFLSLTSTRFILSIQVTIILKLQENVRSRILSRLYSKFRGMKVRSPSNQSKISAKLTKAG